MGLGDTKLPGVARRENQWSDSRRMTPQHAYEIPGRLEQALGNKRAVKGIAQQVVANEECRDTRIVASDQGVALFAAQTLEGSETGSVVIGAIPNTEGIVRDDAIGRGTETGVVFDGNYTRTVMDNCFPHPIVVVVNIDAQQIGLSRHAGLGKEVLNVFGGDEGAENPETLFRQGVGELPNGLLKGDGAAVDPKTVPTLQKEIDSAILRAIADAKFDKRAIGDADAAEDFLDNAVFI